VAQCKGKAKNIKKSMSRKDAEQMAGFAVNALKKAGKKK
jgi:hypothetical protein